ncbi:MAG: hypothetical protein K2X39_07745 [Silvanigrellaceae bacterium]|nr:hypothetical protein [Silvanigrellaceae bacterium]
MRKKITSLFLTLIFFIINIKTFAKSKHLETLISKHPYALLGDDYGILNLDDLAINACRARPSPFTLQDFSDYPRWQCFESKKSKLFCDVQDYNVDYDNLGALLVISAKKNGFKHEYLSRRAIDYDDCKSFAKDWKRLSKNQKYVCVDGSFISQKKASDGGITSYWIFEKFKTKKGCVPYFKHDCDYKYQLKHGCEFAGK